MTGPERPGEHHVVVLIDRGAVVDDMPTFVWRCTCGGRSWRGRHQIPTSAERAAVWHVHHKHGGLVPS